MRIGDITKESLKRKADMEEILRLAKGFFEPRKCTVHRHEDSGFNVSDGSGETIALFTATFRPNLVLYDRTYEETSVEFGRAYEKEILGMKNFSNNVLKAGDFVLEKDYSREKKS